MKANPTPSQRVVLVTGPSGAGRSTAINTLEDLGFEAIDNIPVSLIPRLIDGANALAQPLALGIDARNRDFSVEGLMELHAVLSSRGDMNCELLYLDCLPDILSRRYSETRRRHPLAPDESPADGIARELALLEDVKTRADILVDTSELTIHDLRAEIENWFSDATGQGMAISIHSFSYKRGLPQGLDMAFDCRFLRNPHWEPDLRRFTGLDRQVSDYVAADKRYDVFVKHIMELLGVVLPGCLDEGKAHFSVGFGCTGGKHRSVTLTEAVAAALAKQSWRVSIRHRELERQGVRVTTPVAPESEREASE
ncbi:RNase adapter RapZ [uncultured Pelagimonas sp.]|uniref:RNase adapter RapZ n=1 Tax=uncultured Pelagimonas sp. TaxID=1618102 RepID=UPI00260F21B9|nr:RNase adapter RapZ [uncultured Pelagimonas sp.]